MIERLLLVAWKGSQSVGWAETLRASGYTVLVEETTGERAWRTAKERGIDCVVIDGDKKPSLGRQTGYQLRDTAKTREIPIIWANLNPEEASLVQADVRPDVMLPRTTDAAEVVAAIESLGLAREALRLATQPTPTPPPSTHAAREENVEAPAATAKPVTRKARSVAAKAAPARPGSVQRAPRAKAPAKTTARGTKKPARSSPGKTATKTPAPASKRTSAAKVARKSTPAARRRPTR
jgi:DNA-binding response OmpR family regulator